LTQSHNFFLLYSFISFLLGSTLVGLYQLIML
jgi:hypothetical protein